MFSSPSIHKHTHTRNIIWELRNEQIIHVGGGRDGWELHFRVLPLRVRET